MGTFVKSTLILICGFQIIYTRLYRYWQIRIPSKLRSEFNFCNSDPIQLESPTPMRCNRQSEVAQFKCHAPRQFCTSDPANRKSHIAKTWMPKLRFTQQFRSIQSAIDMIKMSIITSSQLRSDWSAITIGYFNTALTFSRSKVLIRLIGDRNSTGLNGILIIVDSTAPIHL